MSDLISRQAAIDALDRAEALTLAFGYHNVIDTIRELPSAEPEQKKGEWIDRSDGGRILHPWWESCKCNQCEHEGSGVWNFCPNCGADMRGEE